MAIGHQTVDWAVDQLAGMDQAKVDGLKIRSGEHLAALLLTSFLGAPPVETDTSGGVDLLFRIPTDASANLLVPAGTTAAVEVKSVPGDFREYDSATSRWGDERPPTDQGIRVVVQSADAVLSNARPLIHKAATKLSEVRDADTRHIFLLVHPFDQLALEVIEEPLVAAVLQPPAGLQGVDFLWVLWVPDQLTVWSVADESWCQMIFSAFDPECPPTDSGWRSILQTAEERFLFTIKYTSGSPYLFGTETPETS